MGWYNLVFLSISESHWIDIFLHVPGNAKYYTVKHFSCICQYVLNYWKFVPFGNCPSKITANFSKRCNHLQHGYALVFVMALHRKVLEYHFEELLSMSESHIMSVLENVWLETAMITDAFPWHSKEELAGRSSIRTSLGCIVVLEHAIWYGGIKSSHC